MKTFAKPTAPVARSPLAPLPRFDRRALPVRQTANAVQDRESDADYWRRGACLDREVPLRLQPPTFRIERGMTPVSYYRQKFIRFGTLGQFGPLNPYLDECKRWKREACHDKA